MASLFRRAEQLCNFCSGHYEEHFWNYFAFGSMVKLYIYISSSGGQFVQESGTVSAISVEGIMRNISGIILYCCRRRCCFEIFLFLALVACLFGRAEQFVQFRLRAI